MYTHKSTSGARKGETERQHQKMNVLELNLGLASSSEPEPQRLDSTPLLLCIHIAYIFTQLVCCGYILQVSSESLMHFHLK